MIEAKRLFDVPYHQLASYPQENMFVTKTDGEWKPVSTQDFLSEAMEISKGLIAMGVQPGDMIGLVSPTRYEWNVMDIGIQQVGAIVVPFYPNISESDYEYIFNDAGIKLCVVADADLHEKITNIRGEIPTLENLFTMENVSNAKNWSEIKTAGSSEDENNVKSRM